MEMKTIQVVNSLLDMEQASTFLNIRKSTLYDWVMRRKIPVVKLGRNRNRFLLKDLEDFINKNRQPAIHSEPYNLN